MTYEQLCHKNINDMTKEELIIFCNGLLKQNCDFAHENANLKIIIKYYEHEVIEKARKILKIKKEGK